MKSGVCKECEETVKKLFDKDETLFAILWIVIYVVGFSAADMVSEYIGVPKLITVCVGLLLSVLLTAFAGRHGLGNYWGLCSVGSFLRKPLRFLPLVILSLMVLLEGLTWNASVGISILGVISMCFVAYLEELIFRGLLLRSMAKSDLKVAVIVSSLTFGMGHAVNLLMGAPVFDTLLQLVYASAVGFCYTAVVIVGGSIWPCVISHAIVNSLSIFAAPMSPQTKLILAAAQTVLGIGYGFWLFWMKGKGDRNT